MKLYSYIVKIDDGFAPNPFYGCCTLATCKPRIRSAAQVGDWIVGTGSKQKGRQGTLVYAMCITEKMSYDSYWQEPRFEDKRPNLCQSIRKSRGDNIYHRNPENGNWIQEDSCHSNDDGTPNQDHIARDTTSANVLISNDFIYLGGGPAPLIPEFNGTSVCHTGMGHKSNFDDVTVRQFIAWVTSLGEWGYCNDPLEWAVERTRKALQETAGAWKGNVDGEALKRIIYEARRTGSWEAPVP